MAKVRPFAGVLALCALGFSGCGGRSALDLFDWPANDEGAGAVAAGGTPASGRGATSGRAGGATNSAGGTQATGGAATDGEAGSGGSSGRWEPDAPQGGSTSDGGAGSAAPLATQVALGAFHSCAAFDDGSLRCWGAAGYLGSGNEQGIGDDESPSVGADVALEGDVLQVAASWYHSCAVLKGGTLRCFGNGLSGKLGYGNTDDVGDDESPASAGDVSVGGTVTYVSAGPSHTCACLDDGKVRCWGSNASSQLGSSASDIIGDDESPSDAEPVEVGGYVVQVAAGYAHTCALLDTGKVRCWGAGGHGQLGYGNSETVGDDESPAAAGDVEVGGKAVQIVAGLWHTCALLDTASVRCWGAGPSGALGYGNLEVIGIDDTPASAGDVEVGGAVSSLTAGDFGTCALLTSGAVRCWGSGEHGQLGYVSTENVGDDETPATAGDVEVGGAVSHVDMGYLHTCATLRSGAVRCWGRGATGALGYGNLEDIGDDETPAAASDVQTH